jgi:hypothetical protein
MNGMEEGGVRREPNNKDDYGRSKELGRRMRGSMESRHVCRWATATTPGRRWHWPPPLEEHARQRSRGGLSSTTKATEKVAGVRTSIVVVVSVRREEDGEGKGGEEAEEGATW